MFFFLSKTLDLALSPLTWVMALLFAGLLIAIRWPHRRALWRSSLALGLVTLYVFSLAPVAHGLTRGLEASAVDTWRPEQTYDVVVLLGGAVNLLATEPDGKRSFNDNVERLHATYDLLRTGKARHAILSGGVIHGGDPVSEAGVLGAQLVDWGIAPERLVIEDRARNTRENALFTREILEERGWKSVVIVTSAFHMQRSAGCFRAVGLPFDTLAVDRRAYAPDRASLNLLPRAHYLDMSADAIREWAGRLVYRWRGYSVE